jgi:multiple sugar transport system substrate-binding protein
MRKRSSTGVIAGTFVLSLSLAACGSAGGPAAGSGGAGGEIGGEITFQTWNLKNEQYTPYFEALVDAFEAEHPGTEVNWVDQPAEGYQEKLSADATAGTLPDVVDMGPEAAYTLGSAGAILDIAEADPDAEADYLDKAWEAMTFDGLGGGTYGYPWYLNTGPSFFNTALFEECGLDPADLPETYDELFEQARTMGENCDDVSMMARLPVIETFGEYGAQLMNEDGTAYAYNDAAGVELVESFKELYEGQGLTEESLNNLQTNEVEEFKAGRLAYLQGSSYTLNDLKETAPDIYDSIAMGPRIANTAPNMYIESLVVNASSANQATAIAFAKFVTSSENQLEFAKEASVFPSSAGTLEDPHFTEDDGTPETEVRVTTAEQVGEAVVWWPPAFSGAGDAETLREQIALALLGDTSVQDALDASVQYSDERLAAGR